MACEGFEPSPDGTHKNPVFDKNFCRHCRVAKWVHPGTKLDEKGACVMAVHELKTWPEHLAAVQAGVKRAEFRRDDREPRFAAGDLLHLVGWSLERGAYTGTDLWFEVTHVARDGPIPAGFAMLSGRRVPPPRTIEVEGSVTDAK